MSLAKPTNDDEEQPDKSDNEEPVTGRKTGEGESDSEDSESQAVMENRRKIAELQQAVNANSLEIQSKAEAAEVERLQRLVDELLGRLTELEEDYQNLRNYLVELENDHSGRTKTVNRNTAAVKELSAAVFDDNPKCPDCSDGHLRGSGSWLSNKLVCSNEGCGFERKIGEY